MAAACHQDPCDYRKDNIVDVVETYAKPYLKEGDILFVSEKSVACSQKRAIPMSEIKPRPLAKFLTKFVYKSPYGIGLGIPETMEMALRECGTVRILFAAACSAVGKLIGKRGWFYKIAGYRAESIDGPTPYTLPPYNTYVVLGPENPDKVAADIKQRVGCSAAVVDINDPAGQGAGRVRPLGGQEPDPPHSEGQPPGAVGTADAHWHHPPAAPAEK